MAAAKSLTPAEIERVLLHIAHSSNAARNRAMFLLTAMAGLRVSEVACLTLADVCDADGVVRSEVFFSAARVKHGHARTVYINSRLQAELSSFVATRTWRDSAQPLFSTLRGALPCAATGEPVELLNLPRKLTGATRDHAAIRWCHGSVILP
jgi:integrase/recombinase XerD